MVKYILCSTACPLWFLFIQLLYDFIPRGLKILHSLDNKLVCLTPSTPTNHSALRFAMPFPLPQIIILLSLSLSLHTTAFPIPIPPFRLPDLLPQHLPSSLPGILPLPYSWTGGPQPNTNSNTNIIAKRPVVKRRPRPQAVTDAIGPGGMPVGMGCVRMWEGRFGIVVENVVKSGERNDTSGGDGEGWDMERRQIGGGGMM
jgi:hypothetical protein